ncbi:glycoside hydrolase [Mycolicibacterium insubricum]|uniref:Glycoside hydrolase n=2 Tax=Mycolicibacterium insubricum TaxID=444597 RepID=A0A1X0DN29_9MYCO|nr:glycoside hydrolase [Mycolicibacterium insubricum]ORA73775.1 glycoside hydrolase [Mycolicibacterium insubricum]
MLVVVGAGAGADAPWFFRPVSAPVTVELADGWRLASARYVEDDGAAISRLDYASESWDPIRRMPSTVLGALTDAGVYPDPYYGSNMRDAIPQDLYRQDWWYRTTFTAPAGRPFYALELPGINYRAQVWLNGHLVAGDDEVVGMYVSHDLDVTPWIHPGAANALAIRITPEQAVQDIDGVELADSWWDWINWRDIGYRTADGVPKMPSFVPDRNAGIWKPVLLHASGDATLGPASVSTELPLPRTDSARLTVHSTVRNDADHPVRGVMHATISRPGKPTVNLDQSVTLGPREQREVTFTPDDYPGLRIEQPDLWWPYTMGSPNLYDLRLEYRVNEQPIDTLTQRFGIRTVTQHRDDDDAFRPPGAGGNFYLQVNGRDFLVRGATYSPDLLYRWDPARETAILRYVRDLGLNMLRLEGKFPGDHLLQEADELGIPMMYGWMCCNQWEKWGQWDAEDRQVSQDSLRSQIAAFGPHASAFLWANGSDGRPPTEVRDWYHRILAEAHWSGATVDTVSTINKDEQGNLAWDGIRMVGPYSWRPPSYWFDGRYAAAEGSSAEQGDNEHIPPYASLTRFIPPDQLWPINPTWYLHAGSDENNVLLDSTRTAVMRRYGPSRNAEEFATKAQLAHYESTRAQFEAFAAGGWDTHKMTIYWMLNTPWPSFFGNLFDYYLRPGGAYYGAKKGLRPLSVVFDSFATGNRSTANVTIVNQSPYDATGLWARVRTYDLSGRVLDDRRTEGLTVPANGTAAALTLARPPAAAKVFFVRAQLLDHTGGVVTENTYWQSQVPDDTGDPAKDNAFQLQQSSWADLTPLASMARTPLRVRAVRTARDDGGTDVTITLNNPSEKIAFFERAEVLDSPDGDEILPVEYSDNYVTVYPGESVQLQADVPAGSAPGWVRVTGYNTDAGVVPIADANR